MKYAQSVCALNLFTCKPTLDQLVQTGCKHFHLDLTDFCYTNSFGLNLASVTYLLTQYPTVEFDIHCMMQNKVELLLKQLAQFSQTLRVSLPLQWFKNHPDYFQFQSQNLQLGIMLEANDTVTQNSSLLKQLAFIVVMTINKIGGTGESLNPQLLEKVKQLKQLNPKLLVFSDGGLRFDNLHLFKQSGVDIAVGGSIVNHYPTKDQTPFMTFWKQHCE